MFNKNAKIELLAPAKNKQTAFHAINAGADAIYIGYLKFGARSAAGNQLEDIIETTSYAHKFKAKVYVTLNTIFKNDEIFLAQEIIKNLYDAKVDGIIIQDMGLLELDLPPIPLIASTQCHNNTLEKIKFLEETGFKRVILPREFSIEEIKNITDNTNVEIETFVHGALCVSYSGQCYMSYAIGGRSANRGECAQPCRKRYSLKDSNGKIIAKDKYLLSLKDFNLSSELETLLKLGVTSFKIEGRLKDESYIKNIVSYYRIELDKALEKMNMTRSSIGETHIEFTPSPTKTFNRGYTTFFLKERNKDISAMEYSKSIGEYIGKVKEIGKDYFTMNNKYLHKADGICFFDENKELQGTRINKIENNKIYPNSMFGFTSGTHIYRNFDYEFNNQLESTDILRKIKVDINIYETENKFVFNIIDEEGIGAKLEIEKNYEPARNTETAIVNIKKQMQKLGETEFTINEITVTIKNIPFISLKDLNEIRRNLISILQEKRAILYTQEIRTQDINCIDYPIKELSYKANVFNDKAKEFYEKRGVKKIESGIETHRKVKEKEIMTTKHCLKYLFNMCSKHNPHHDFKEPLFLIDEFGKEYQLEFDCKNCLMKIKI